jgi:hypothetical protein
MPAPLPHPTSLVQRVAQLRRQADACRRQAIALNAKLLVLERERSELRAVREHLVESTARLDHAVDDIANTCDQDSAIEDALSPTACELLPPASLRP